MAYSHDAFPFPMDHQPQPNVYFHPVLQYASFTPQPQPLPETMFPQHVYPDYAEYMPFGVVLEDYEDGTEISTRPRLTKEQVEVLESQFQAHPKPNGMIKKQLAIQTKLTLPRVANWFQNRRAKAKQLRKQEEFEMAQSMGPGSDWRGDRKGTGEWSSKTSSPVRRPSTHENASEGIDSKPSVKSTESVKEAGWASLQRALGAAEAGRRQQAAQEQSHHPAAMPPPDLPRYNDPSMQSPPVVQRAQTLDLSPISDWPQTQHFNGLRSPPLPVSASTQDLGFDFGFDQDSSSTGHSCAVEDTIENGSQHYIVPSEDWTTQYSGPVSTTSQPSDSKSLTPTSPLPLPAYPDSRRGSDSDELTANMGTFALDGTPPIATAPLSQTGSIRSTDGEIDIASRRKRPRPAALTSASLRSRSYGQLTCPSPAFRSGPPSGNTLRHVKSTGHNLNSHYAGIRKYSIPQKSPLNLAGFAESESLKRLMAQQAAANTSRTPLTTPSGPEMESMSIPQDLASQLGLSDDKSNIMLPSELLAQYQQLHSPPHTPFQTDYMMQASMQATPSSMPPPSARSQYASFPEYTPPYSAGPLTNSTCWSDAPLHSPDVTGFSSGQYMPPLAFASQQESYIPQWMLPSESLSGLGPPHLGLLDDNKKTEFFITEFPGQKEEYASIAQHVPPPKPKSYVFANTAPSDYDG